MTPTQVPDATVWYGPDTYMGRNLQELFTRLASMPDEDVRALHPAHTAASVRALLPRLHYFDAGTCIVHHIFGGETCELVRQVRGARCWHGWHAPARVLGRGRLQLTGSVCIRA